MADVEDLPVQEREVSPKHAQDAAALAAFLPYVEVLDLDQDAALHHAEISADLKKVGAMIGANDLFIAAHARALSLTLVTNDTAGFERVKGLALESSLTKNPDAPTRNSQCITRPSGMVSTRRGATPNTAA